MTSWTDSHSTTFTGGEVVYLLEIYGIGVFTTYDYTPADSWFTDAGYGAARVYPWLKFDALGPLDDSSNFIDGVLEVDGIQAKISNVGDQLVGLVKDWKARVTTWLTTNVTDTATVWPVVGTSGFTSTTNEVYCGQEVAQYTGTTATTFTGLTRGILGTTPRAYTVRIDADSGVYDQPVVSDGPHVLAGRRAILHAAFMNGSGAVGSTSVIFRGRVGKRITTGADEWILPIDHISEVLLQKVGQNMPQSELRSGFYFHGTDDITGFSGTIYLQFGTTTFSDYILIPQGWYSAEELAEAWNDAARGAGPTTYPFITLAEDKFRLSTSALAGTRPGFRVFEGDPLWCLGFEPGIYDAQENTATYWDAKDEPRLFCLQWGNSSIAGSHEPFFEVDDASLFTAGLYIQIPGNGWGRVKSASGNTITLEAGQVDIFRNDPYRPWVIEDEEDDMICRHVIVLGSVVEDGVDTTLKAAMQRCLGLQSGQLEPIQWLAAGSEAADFDWTELDTALSTAPAGLNTWHDCINEGIEFGRIFGHALGCLAIAPRITDEGKIGFVRLTTPTSSVAETVEVDDDVWSLLEATEIRARLGEAPLINCTQILTTHDYAQESGGGGGDGGKKGWSPPVKVSWLDGFNTFGSTRTIKYECRGWLVGTTGTAASSLIEFGRTMDQQIRATHYGIFGRESFTVDIRCTWPAKMFKVGDVVKVTHELITDNIEGVTGVTSRLGIVVGRTQQTTGDDSESLRVQFGAELNAAGIAPCALFDDSDAEAGICSDDTIYSASGTSDLSRFAVGEKVRFITYDNTSAGDYYSTITDINIGTGRVTFEDEFSVDPNMPGAGVPVWMVPFDWDDASTAHKAFAYLADNAAEPTLGTAEDAPQEWTI